MSGSRAGTAAKSKKRAETDGIPLAQKAYAAVREAVERGELAPGDKVSEYQVARWLSMSRTPAREALLRLELEGLLSFRPRRGLVVVEVDDAALEELFQARELVDSGIARLAAINGSGPELSAILRACDVEATLVDDGERMHWHNLEFHDLIRKAAHNRYLARAGATLQEIVAADSRGSNFVDPERRHVSMRDHRELAEAIAERRADDAAAVAARHIRGAREVRKRLPSATASAQ